MLTGWYKEHMPRWAKILIQIFTWGWAGGTWRILLFVDDCIAKKENKNVFALIVGIINCIPIVNFVFWIIDTITVLTKDDYTVLVGKPE